MIATTLCLSHPHFSGKSIARRKRDELLKISPEPNADHCFWKYWPCVQIIQKTPTKHARKKFCPSFDEHTAVNSPGTVELGDDEGLCVDYLSGLLDNVRDGLCPFYIDLLYLKALNTGFNEDGEVMRIVCVTDFQLTNDAVLFSKLLAGATFLRTRHTRTVSSLIPPLLKQCALQGRLFPIEIKRLTALFSLWARELTFEDLDFYKFDTVEFFNLFCKSSLLRGLEYTSQLSILFTKQVPHMDRGFHLIWCREHEDAYCLGNYNNANFFQDKIAKVLVPTTSLSDTNLTDENETKPSQQTETQQIETVDVEDHIISSDDEAVSPLHTMVRDMSQASNVSPSIPAPRRTPVVVYNSQLQRKEEYPGNMNADDLLAPSEDGELCVVGTYLELPYGENEDHEQICMLAKIETVTDELHSCEHYLKEDNIESLGQLIVYEETVPINDCTVVDERIVSTECTICEIAADASFDPPVIRRSTRTIKPVDRLTYDCSTHDGEEVTEARGVKRLREQSISSTRDLTSDGGSGLSDLLVFDISLAMKRGINVRNEILSAAHSVSTDSHGSTLSTASSQMSMQFINEVGPPLEASKVDNEAVLLETECIVGQVEEQDIEKIWTADTDGTANCRLC